MADPIAPNPKNATLVMTSEFTDRSEGWAVVWLTCGAIRRGRHPDIVATWKRNDLARQTCVELV